VVPSSGYRDPVRSLVRRVVPIPLLRYRSAVTIICARWARPIAGFVIDAHPDLVVIGLRLERASWYIVDIDAADALVEARLLVENSQFTISDVVHPNCDGTASAPACAFFATRDVDHVRVAIFRSVQGSGLESVPSGSSAVWFTAER
jgi:hypothetical protein